MDQVFFDGKQAVDAVGPNGLGLYSGKSQEQMEQERSGSLEIISTEEAFVRMSAAATTGPKEVSSKDFNYALDCLPPLKWSQGGGGESFRIPEAMTVNIYTAFVRIGKRYFRLDQPLSVTHSELLAMVAAAIRVDTDAAAVPA